MRILPALLLFTLSSGSAVAGPRDSTLGMDPASFALGTTLLIKNMSDRAQLRSSTPDFRPFLVRCRMSDGSDAAAYMQTTYDQELESARPKHRALATGSATVRELMAAQANALRQAVDAFHTDCLQAAQKQAALATSLQAKVQGASGASPCEDNRLAANAYRTAVTGEQEQIEAKKKLGQRIRQLASEERKRERSALGQIRPDLSGPDRQALAKEEEKSIFCARSFFQRDCMSPFERLSEGVDSLREAEEEHLETLKSKAQELDTSVKNCGAAR